MATARHKLPRPLHRCTRHLRVPDMSAYHLQRCAPTLVETMHMRAMPVRATHRDGAIGPHAHGSVGRQVVDD